MIPIALLLALAARDSLAPGASASRSPIVRGGKVIEMITLISPYPDATLDRLLEGTLVIALSIRRPEARGRGPENTLLPASGTRPTTSANTDRSEP
jgi:hypothetical protein